MNLFGKINKKIRLGILAALLAVMLLPTPAVGQEARKVIFVTSNDWHTGISLARNQIPLGRIPEAADFPDAKFIEFGWGDAVFYPARKKTLTMTLSAALKPTKAVMHVVGQWTEPKNYFRQAESVGLPISEENYLRLVAFIHDSFERGKAPRAQPSGPGLYRSSRFYPARGKFHLFNTCNSWTARALATAGFDVEPSGTYRAEGVMGQIRARPP